MLTKFAVKNYRGFSDRIEWNLSSPSNYEFNQSAIKNGTIKNGILYGANGSGKTNLGLAVFDIVNHLSQKQKKPDYYSNFVYAGTPNALVEFEYNFLFDGRTVKYSYAKAKNGKLINESLIVGERVVFCREGKVLNIDVERFPMDATIKSELSDNINGVSIMNYLLSAYPLFANDPIVLVKNFVDGMLWFRSLGQNEFIGFETHVYIMEEFIIKKKLVKDFSIFLNKVSGQNFTFVEPNKNDKMLMCVYGKEKVPFNDIISTGTHSLILLYFWLQKMNEATFVFIDEFDAFYHFELSYEVCVRLFNLDCQVFLSSHNTYLMTNELLRPDCNFILNNNKVLPLCECTEKELRFANNIEKLYRGGSFKL